MPPKKNPPSVSTPSHKPLTVAHVTHEAVEQLGGIGTVLEGLMISPVYQQAIGRSILIGPTSTNFTPNPETRLGEHGQVLYSSVDNIDRVNLGGKLRPIEWAFNVSFVYGKRTYAPPGEGRQGEAEVLLIDIFRINHDRLNRFKFRIGERFGLESWRYEAGWDYEEYVRIAEPAYYALLALLTPQEFPCVLFSHEYMGVATALQCILDGGDQFRTVFHAHECSTARKLVEDHPGHDTAFYNILDQARQKKIYVQDIFGSLDQFARHALISRTHLFDGIIAVGDRTRDEFKFLSDKFEDHPIDVVYNGLPAMKVTPADKQKSRDMLLQYSQALVGYKPDLLMTHVTRPVISKGLWRDMKVCHELDLQLGKLGKKGVLYILTSGGGVRRSQDVLHMEQTYGWPRHHREGYPDLTGPESDIQRMIDPFNAEHQHVQVVLVNQFGWSRARIGSRLPKDMDIADLRRGTDVEFGMAIYEPFGISPLEPLGSGAVCVISNVCGCEGFVQHVTQGKGTPNVITADYTKLNRSMSLDELKHMGRTERDAVEITESKRIADQIVQRAPWLEKNRQQLIQSGQALVARMGWDQVLEDGLLPMLNRIVDTGNHPE